MVVDSDENEEEDAQTRPDTLDTEVNALLSS